MSDTNIRNRFSENFANRNSTINSSDEASTSESSNQSEEAPSFPESQSNNRETGNNGNRARSNNTNRDRGNAEPNNNMNRNNMNHLLNVREQLSQALFCRLAITYARFVPPFVRRLLEFAILIQALTLLFLLIYIHVQFNGATITCLDHIKDNWAKDGVLRIEVISNADPNYDLEASYIKEEQLNEQQSDMGSFVSDFDFIFSGVDFVGLGSTPQTEKDNSTSNMPQHENVNSSSYENETPVEYFEEYDETFSSNLWHDFSTYDHIVEFSTEFGFLRLSPATRKRLNISVTLVVLDPNKNQCFGDALSKIIINDILGYDDILMGSVKSLVQETKGYFRNVVTGQYYRFINIWIGSWNYLAAAFVMITFTLSVSTLLRYSHHQLFMFIVDLLQMIEVNGGVSFPAAPMLTVILALVGMEAIMSEFFKDTSTAFYIIVIVWFCDQYEALCCYTPVTKKHWLRFFYLYHFAFYAHHYRFFGQYSWMALMTSWSFILHSMLFFFHHYELPALLIQNNPAQFGLPTINIVVRNSDIMQVAQEGLDNTRTDSQNARDNGQSAQNNDQNVRTNGQNTPNNGQINRLRTANSIRATVGGQPVNIVLQNNNRNHSIPALVLRNLSLRVLLRSLRGLGLNLNNTNLRNNLEQGNVGQVTNQNRAEVAAQNSEEAVGQGHTTNSMSPRSTLHPGPSQSAENVPETSQNSKINPETSQISENIPETSQNSDNVLETSHNVENFPKTSQISKNDSETPQHSQSVPDTSQHLENTSGTS